MNSVERSWPAVTVFMAVRNEETHLESAVRSALDTGYEGPVHVVLAVGPSEDATAAIAARLARDLPVTVVDNPHGGTPQGLNAALAHCTTPWVVRMDGHAELPAGYIEHAVRALESTGAANVGGRMVPDADHPFPRAVAVAMSSQWGIGGAGHRVGGEAGPAESVYLGAFSREAVDQVGGYDDHYARAQDWELNLRLRRAGHTVWFVPQMQVPYRPRGTWRALVRQFHHSGRWRREVTTRHGLSVGLRYLVPPVVTAVVAVSVVVASIGVVVQQPWLMAGGIPAVGYLVGVLTASATLIRRTGPRAAVWLPVVLITMHTAWGSGFLRGLR